MAYEVRLNNVKMHPTGSSVFVDNKEDPPVKMVITGKWKTIGKKTEKLKAWEKSGIVQVRSIQKKEKVEPVVTDEPKPKKQTKKKVK